MTGRQVTQYSRPCLKLSLVLGMRVVAVVWTLQSNACLLLRDVLYSTSCNPFAACLPHAFGSPLCLPVRRLRLAFLLPLSLGACPSSEDAAAVLSLSLVVEAFEAAGLASLALRCFFTPAGKEHCSQGCLVASSWQDPGSVLLVKSCSSRGDCLCVYC